MLDALNSKPLSTPRLVVQQDDPLSIPGDGHQIQYLGKRQSVRNNPELKLGQTYGYGIEHNRWSAQGIL